MPFTKNFLALLAITLVLFSFTYAQEQNDYKELTSKTIRLKNLNTTSTTQTIEYPKTIPGEKNQIEQTPPNTNTQNNTNTKNEPKKTSPEPTSIPNTETCTDTDNGINPNTPGTITFQLTTLITPTKNGTITIQGNKNATITDTCKNNTL
ncbi:MAG: hypothetical protein QXT97_04955, partial [Candidatus Diapherotrites archaeon]